jgi:glycogen debranching enzyme
LRRAAISWGDSIKFRYGKSRDENPFLWDYMAQYVRDMASVFDGIRIDNAHNTPLHVAKYMIT